jgi:hypothetical protein
MGTLGHEAEVWEEIALRGESIGHNVVIKYYGDEKAGLLLYHRHSDGSVCGGAVAFALPHGAPSVAKNKDVPNSRALWKVIHLDPLTLSPSIKDDTCQEKLHGHIVAGRWIPC